MLWIICHPHSPLGSNQWRLTGSYIQQGLFFAHAAPAWLLHRPASKILQLLLVLFADVERVRMQGRLRGLRGCTATTVPFDIHSPLRVIKPALNPGGRQIEGPAGPGHRDLAPSMISITSTVLPFAVQHEQ